MLTLKLLEVKFNIWSKAWAWTQRDINRQTAVEARYVSIEGETGRD
jgi:hypothetical protein